MTTLRTRMQATLLGAAVALAFTNAGAADIDLTGGYNICAATDGATVCSANDDDGSTGSGTFPSFVGTNGGRPDTFFMYNTTNPSDDGNDVGNGNPKNRDVTLGDFAVTDFGGVDVFTFVLDINQINTDPILTLNHVSIFMGDGSLTGYDAGADTLGGVAATWAMPVDDLITLDYSWQRAADAATCSCTCRSRSLTASASTIICSSSARSAIPTTTTMGSRSGPT